MEWPAVDHQIYLCYEHEVGMPVGVLALTSYSLLSRTRTMPDMLVYFLLFCDNACLVQICIQCCKSAVHCCKGVDIRDYESLCEVHYLKAIRHYIKCISTFFGHLWPC